jgi:putative ABC transport system ATP-binding protein
MSRNYQHFQAGMPEKRAIIREEKMIRLNAIKKNYHLGQTTVEALKSISFEIKEGNFICISGSSGSGKTTLLNIIGCLDKQDQGNYSLDGISIDQIPDRELYKIRKKYIGFIFQNFNLIPVLTAYENVEYPLILENIPKNEGKNWWKGRFRKSNFLTVGSTNRISFPEDKGNGLRLPGLW